MSPKPVAAMAARTPLSGVAQGLTIPCQDWQTTDNRLHPSILFQKTLEICPGGCMGPEEAQCCREGELEPCKLPPAQQYLGEADIFFS